MKKTIFFFTLILGCDHYTIKNSYIEDVRAGYTVIRSGQCVAFFDFPVLGDFPLKFRYKDHQLMSSALYQPGHYEISQTGDILKKNQSCDLDPVKQKDDSESVQNIEPENTKNGKADSSIPLDAEKDTADNAPPVDNSKPQDRNSDPSNQEESQQPANPKLNEESDTKKLQQNQDSFELIEV